MQGHSITYKGLPTPEIHTFNHAQTESVIHIHGWLKCTGCLKERYPSSGVNYPVFLKWCTLLNFFYKHWCLSHKLERWTFTTWSGLMYKIVQNCTKSMYYTRWPRKNAATLIVNFMSIVDETELFSILCGRTFIFQQNDTMIISFW